MIHLDYRDARPIYVQIVDTVRGQIAAGILREGDKLLSVRELAGQLSINPNTIQRAYRELEAGGWIATVPGKGCFVCAGADTGAEREPLWKDFDQAAAALRRSGVTTQALIRRLEQGGNEHA